MRVYLFRLSLSEKSRDLFSTDGEIETRTEVLTNFFSSDREFNGHGNTKLKYGFSQQDNKIISGAIGKWVTETKENDPHNFWSEGPQEHWEKSAVFFNLDQHEQVIGIENRKKVGEPNSLVKYLTKCLNDYQIYYHVEYFPITKKEDFWGAVENYTGKITSITFDLVIPNPSDASGETAKALKELKKNINADRVKTTTSNQDGLKLESDLLRDSVNYAASGAGSLVVKSNKDIIYSSSDHTTAITVDDDLKPMKGGITGLAANLENKLVR